MLAWKLTIEVPHAAFFELERGAQAAQAYIEGLGFTVPEAADGDWKLECSEPAHLLPGEEPPEVTDRDIAAAEAWDDAAKVAADACCAGWDKEKPKIANLCLIDYGKVITDALDALYAGGAPRREVTTRVLGQALRSMIAQGATDEEVMDELASIVAFGLTTGSGTAEAAAKLRKLADQVESAPT